MIENFFNSYTLDLAWWRGAGELLYKVGVCAVVLVLVLFWAWLLSGRGGRK